MKTLCKLTACLIAAAVVAMGVGTAIILFLDGAKKYIEAD